MQLAQLQKEHQKKVDEATGRGAIYKARAFLKPTGYKPLLILIGLFLMQQFSGIYITLFHSVRFFEVRWYPRRNNKNTNNPTFLNHLLH
jgi:facilitated trehalose transporter